MKYCWVGLVLCHQVSWADLTIETYTKHWKSRKRAKVACSSPAGTLPVSPLNWLRTWFFFSVFSFQIVTWLEACTVLLNLERDSPSSLFLPLFSSWCSRFSYLSVKFWLYHSSSPRKPWTGPALSFPSVKAPRSLPWPKGQMGVLKPLSSPVLHVGLLPTDGSLLTYLGPFLTFEFQLKIVFITG